MRLGSGILLSVHLLSTAIVARSEPGPQPGATPEFAAEGCVSRAGGPRWATAQGEYVRSAVYGQEPNGWLASVAGIAVAPDGEVVVYDAASARIVVLTEGLRPVREFGRRGEGPGELSTLPVPGAVASLFRYVDVTDSLIFAYDSLDIHGQVRRRWQTWAISGETRSLVFELPLENPPTPGGMVYAHPREARPLWGVHGSCVIVADEASEHLLVYDRGTARIDTIPLPAHKVPPPDATSEAGAGCSGECARWRHREDSRCRT